MDKPLQQISLLAVATLYSLTPSLTRPSLYPFRLAALCARRNEAGEGKRETRVVSESMMATAGARSDVGWRSISPISLFLSLSYPPGNICFLSFAAIITHHPLFVLGRRSIRSALLRFRYRQA